MKKATHGSDRSQIKSFQQIINVGPAIESDFKLLGFTNPQQLIGQAPWDLYCRLCKKTKVVHDPCVLDVFMASVDFMNGNPPRKWWDFTKARKEEFGEALQDFSV